MMRIILISLMLCLLVGCQEKIDPVKVDLEYSDVQKATIDTYVKENPTDLTYIITANGIVQEQKYDMAAYAHSVISFKNKLLREMFVALETPNERLAVLNLTDLIFKLANEEFQRQDFDLIEPEYLEKVKYLFDNAAMTAQFLRGGLK